MNLHYAWLEQCSLLEFLVKGFIFGVVVDAAAPSGTSLAVMNLLSFSSCESLVGTGIHFSPVHRYSVRSTLLN